MAEYFANRITFAMVPVGARDDTTYGLTCVGVLAGHLDWDAAH